MLAPPIIGRAPDANAASRASARRSHNRPAARPLSRFEYFRLLMGMKVRIVVYAPDEGMAVDACAAAFRRIAVLDDIMSDYRADSELMRLCAKAGGPPVKVSPDLFRVLQRAQDVARRSDGAFDATVGPLVALWRRVRKEKRLPTPEELQQAQAIVGWQKLTLDPAAQTAKLAVSGMRLDLGGIAKGYADDCAQAVLRQHGITRALVEAGGDIVVSGPPPGTAGWRIRVPGAGEDGKDLLLTIANRGISSSGDTEQFVEVNGRRYSHIVNPHTGVGLTDRIAVTIVAPDGITGDSLSTAVSVLGAEKGAALAKTYAGVTAYIRRATE